MPAKAFPELGLNMVYVDDVADGILLAYDKGKPGESYVLGGELTTQGELIDKAAAIGGKKPPRMTVPPLVLKAMIPVSRWIGPAMGLPPNFREMISAAHNVTYWAKDDKARRELGYQPRDLDTGLREHDPGRLAALRGQLEPLDRRHHARTSERVRHVGAGQHRCSQPAGVADGVAMGAERTRGGVELLDPAVPEVAALVGHAVAEQLLDPELHPVGMALRRKPPPLECAEHAVGVRLEDRDSRGTRPPRPGPPARPRRAA